jgi:type III secretory pathway lipoprotein EscJ
MTEVQEILLSPEQKDALSTKLTSGLRRNREQIFVTGLTEAEIDDIVALANDNGVFAEKQQPDENWELYLGDMTREYIDREDFTPVLEPLLALLRQ